MRVGFGVGFIFQHYVTSKQRHIITVLVNFACQFTMLLDIYTPRICRRSSDAYFTLHGISCCVRMVKHQSIISTTWGSNISITQLFSR